VTHCNTLQHTATHCNTLQHTGQTLFLYINVKHFVATVPRQVLVTERRTKFSKMSLLFDWLYIIATDLTFETLFMCALLQWGACERAQWGACERAQDVWADVFPIHLYIKTTFVLCLQCVAVCCSVLQCVMTFDASIVSLLLDSLYKMDTERTFWECVPVCCCNEVPVTEHER